MLLLVLKLLCLTFILLLTVALILGVTLAGMILGLYFFQDSAISVRQHTQMEQTKGFFFLTVASAAVVLVLIAVLALLIGGGFNAL